MREVADLDDEREVVPRVQVRDRVGGLVERELGVPHDREPDDLGRRRRLEAGERLPV